MSQLYKRPASLFTLIFILVISNPHVVQATPDGDSWQKQTLLATTSDQYLLLETSWYTAGYPLEYIEAVRYVIYNAKTNEQLTEIPVSMIKTIVLDGTDRTEVLTPASDTPLSRVLSDFKGEIPRTAKNLTKPFKSDETGLYVLDGKRKVLVFTAKEMLERKSGAGNVYNVELPRVIDLQFGSGRYYLTMRSYFGNGGHEVVMAMIR